MKDYLVIVAKPIALLVGLVTLAIGITSLVTGFIDDDGAMVTAGTTACILGGLLVASVWNEITGR